MLSAHLMLRMLRNRKLISYFRQFYLLIALATLVWFLRVDFSSLRSRLLGETESLLPQIQNFEQRPTQTSCNNRITAHPATIVIASMKGNNTSWMKDLKIHPNDNVVLYVGDDITAKYHNPMNKGRESMQYLSYLIEHYSRLPELMIFIHAGRGSWQNNSLLGRDLLRMLTLLRRDHVVDKGFINLRCDWKRGCPDFFQMNISDSDPWYNRVQWTKNAYRELFPGHLMPSSVAVPGGGQFAVTQEMVYRVPFDRLVFFRNW